MFLNLVILTELHCYVLLNVLKGKKVFQVWNIFMQILVFILEYKDISLVRFNLFYLRKMLYILTHV